MLTFIAADPMPDSNMNLVTLENRTDKPVAAGHLSVQPGERHRIWRTSDKIFIPPKGRTVSGVIPSGQPIMIGEKEYYNETEERQVVCDHVEIDGISYLQG